MELKDVFHSGFRRLRASILLSHEGVKGTTSREQWWPQDSELHSHMQRMRATLAS